LKGEDGLEAVLPLRSLGGVREHFSRIKTPLEPIQYFNFNFNFNLNPSDPARSELYPLGEFPSQFKSRNVLRRVQNQLLDSTL
jgi:hypothetical protein